MNKPFHQSRRIFLLTTTVSVATATTTACQDATMNDRQLVFKTIDQAMHKPFHQSRRIFLLTTTVSVATATTACQDATMNDRQLVFKTIDQAMQELDRLVAAPALKIATGWTLAQTLDHCAQSIEYSIAGFPESKSALFQATAGALAFKFFTVRGRMSHSLTEPIPGAPELDANLQAANARLRRAVQGFQGHNTALRPHFAYGELSKPAYEQAHAMHLANHFSAFDVMA